MPRFLRARLMETASSPDASGAGNGGPVAQATQAAQAKPGAAPSPTDFAAQIMQAMGPQITNIVNQAVAPIQAQATQLAADLAAARQPQRQAAAVFGGGPGNGGVIVGERAVSRGFEFQRALGYQQGMEEFQPENCKVEREFCQDLRALYRQAGLSMDGVPVNGREPMLCVLDTNYIPDQFKATLAQKYGSLPQFMTQSLAGADPNQLKWLAKKHQQFAPRINQALSQFDDSGMGIFLEPGPHGEMIDYIRPREALTKAGVRDIALPPNGYLPFGSQTGTSTGYWVGEAAATTQTQPVTGRKEMRAKKAAALVQVPNELFKFASGTTEAFIRADVGAIIALLEDKAGLEGTGTSTQPLGVRNLPGVLKHTRTLVVGTNGNQFEPRTASAMIVDVQDRNYDVDNDGWAWIMRAPMWEEISTRRAVMFSGGSETGPYLFPTQAADLSKGLGYDTLRGYNVVKSGQVSNTITKGSSSSLSYVVGGIWRNCLRGRVGVIEFAMATQGDSLFPNYISQLRAIDFVDFLFRYETCFSIADQIDMTLPNG
jgi:HK97 family phage major capsid protein